MPERVQMTRQRPWRADHPHAVIVARPSSWGNPFKLGRRYIVFDDLGWGMGTEREVGRVFDGVAEVVEVADRRTAVNLYRAWMISRTTTAIQKTDLSLIQGRDLACWCPLDQPCHADVLLEMANQIEVP